MDSGSADQSAPLRLVDSDGRPESLLATGDAIRTASFNGSLADAQRQDFERTTPETTLNEVREKLREHGMRLGMRVAPAPTITF